MPNISYPEFTTKTPRHKGLTKFSLDCPLL